MFGSAVAISRITSASVEADTSGPPYAVGTVTASRPASASSSICS
jgi:hypothetical protein